MPKSKRVRAVFDTNLIISAALIPQSPPDKLFKLWPKALFDLLVSKEQLAEIEAVSKKGKLKAYPVFSERVEEFIQNLQFAAELVKPVPEADLPVHCRDPKDDHILAASLGGKADYLVTGDEDLLALGTKTGLEKLKIVSVRQFLSVITPTP